MLFMFHVSLFYAIFSVGRLLGWAGILCVVFSCVFVAFSCGVLGSVWCLVVSIPVL